MDPRYIDLCLWLGETKSRQIQELERLFELQ
jgi:hypothetical protein